VYESVCIAYIEEYVKYIIYIYINIYIYIKWESLLGTEKDEEEGVGVGSSS